MRAKNLTIITVFITCFSINVSAEVIQFYSFRAGKRVANDLEYNKGFADTAKDIDKYGLGIPKINVKVIPEDENAAFDMGSNIQIPRTMVKRSYYGSEVEYKNTMLTQAVFAHEYAHAVFDLQLINTFPNYARIKNIASQMSALDLKLMSTEMSEAGIKANRAAYQLLKVAYNDDSKLLNQVNLISPYNELFADTVAVFLNDSKDIIAEALMPPYPAKPNIPIPIHDQAGFASAKARRFDAKRDPKTWGDPSPHNFFSPLRSVIGSDQCWPTTQADKVQKLKYLVKILIEQIKEKDKTKAPVLMSDNTILINEYKKICH